MLSYHALEAFSATDTHGERRVVGGRLTDGRNDDMKLIEGTNAWKQRSEEDVGGR